MTKNLLQPGEAEAESAELGAAAIKDRLADIREKVEKQKIPLTKEVEDYTRANLRKVQDKLAEGVPIYPADMEFIGKVKMWLEIRTTVRMKYQSIEEMEKELPEAQKRNITLKQWFALLHVAGLKTAEGLEMFWIQREAEFPGNGKIRINHLDLKGCTGLTRLPDNLKVEQWLSLFGCTGLTCIPQNLMVGEGMNIRDCTGLTSLPDDLQVGNHLYISKDAPEQIKLDAEKLKKEEKIKGQVYIQ